MAADEISESGVIIRPLGRLKTGVDYDSGTVVYDCKPPVRIFCSRCLNCTSVWLVKDCLGLSCASITWFLIGYAQFVVLFVILIPSTNQIHSFVNGVIFEFFMFLAVASHLKAMMSDPGAVVRGNATGDNIARLGLREGQVIYKCVKCNSIKPERAHHCSTCQRCIRKMDHHCPWVNNCVGEDNQKFFVLFTMYICLASIQALYLCAFHFITCSANDWNDCRTLPQALSTILMMFLLVEGLLFGVFTGIMCASQIVSIASDETGIEMLKHDRVKREQESCWYHLKVMFGHPFSYRWFSPFHSVQQRKLSASLYDV